MGRYIIYRDIKRFISCICKRTWGISFVLQKVLVMKKIILLALTALMVVGCNYASTDHITSDGKRVVLIDSCEYIKYSSGYGAHYSHKGNCRFCKERKQKELEKLIKQLKEK